jgi:RNA polymerase sigma-70 factor (ECF subfamily)
MPGSSDDRSFEDLYRRHHPAVLNYVYRISGGNATLAEDVAQQVFLNFWNHRGEYDLSKSLTPLLLTMARNAWVNAVKREDYRKTAPLQEDLAPASPAGRAGGLEEKELEEVLERALASLDPAIREVFVLSRYHEMKYNEIAQLMGISVKTVEARLSRALRELEEKLKDFLK